MMIYALALACVLNANKDCDKVAFEMTPRDATYMCNLPRDTIIYFGVGQKLWFQNCVRAKSAPVGYTPEKF